MQLDCGYRLDFVVGGVLIVELKAVTELHPIHEAQLLTYLKLDKKSLGLLINFNVPTLKQGVKRVASGDLFKEETGGRSFGFRLISFLCASVPLLQIYRQTLSRLKDRDDPYRQHLDMVSAGKTLILEKTDGFAPQDVEEHLAVLILMLPSASRANKEALRMFRDSGTFQTFFPADEDKEGHAKLLERIPILETFEVEDAYWGRQVKTSLGNTIRLLEPLIILDEGHKAYSGQAQDTLRKLNPCMIVELSATPPKEANNLVVISGEELHREEMIKLDLHVINKSSTSWRDTMRAAMERRNDLEQRAHDYEGNTNVYIRPICLIQVERAGKEQRDGKLIHAEDVREYLIGQGVQKDWIAVKSAEIDELKDFDDIGGLLVRDCPVRYIITKQALQEGWDCSFACVRIWAAAR